MKIMVRAVGALFLAAGVLAIPSVAQAADGAPLFGALTERNEAGGAKVYPIHQGETVPVVLGVTNKGTGPSAGVVVNIRVIDDLDLPKSFTNCRYYVDHNLHGAWCEIAGELPVGGTYALSQFSVTAAPDAKTFSAVTFQWFPKDWADKNGGIDGFAERDSRGGPAPVAGTGDELKLEPRELPIPAETARVGFAYLKLIAPPASPSPSDSPSPSPSDSATATATPTPTSTDAAGGGGGGDGGGLPLTGTNTAFIAGAGAVLLLIGGIVVAAFRRRTRFTA
jgi:LPXTG-motif cell wall-anchored protein